MAEGHGHRAPSRIAVRIVHGDLAYAQAPIVVGHYEGDTIVSAEAALDRILGGRLSERLRLGLYPGTIGSAQLFLAAPGGAPGAQAHPGAIIVGLGQVGELTPGGLITGVRQAALAYASARAETAPAAHDRDRIGVELSALLIGTGAGGLSLADSLQSILRAALQANAALAGNRSATARRVRIARLDLLELFEDRAIIAARTLDQIRRQPEFRARISVPALLVGTENGRRRVAFEEDPAWWQRLRIQEIDGDGTLRFEPLTDRARAPALLNTTEHAAVRRFLARATTVESSVGDRITHTLFKMLLPKEIRERAQDRRPVVLVLDSAAAAYPWELLRSSLDDDVPPLAVEAGLVRQLFVSSYRKRVETAKEDRALVVGDPPSSFRPLPAAQVEASDVAKRLERTGFQTTALIGADAADHAVSEALNGAAYRVMHLAGHGVFEFDPSPRRRGSKRTRITGMVLGDGEFLTPERIDRLDAVPDFVFVNCCHLGQTGGERAVEFRRLAANLGTQLIRMGVRAVIAAGWPVEDRAAREFANVFYDNFLKGVPFGEAVRLAREATYRRHRHVNTWGAYQCYGDPAFALRTRRASRQSGGWRFVAPSELAAELANLARRARSASATERAQMATRLEREVRRIPSAWLDRAAIRAGLGEAYGELGRFKAAIAHLEACRVLEPADAALRALEQLANLKARYAVSLARDGHRGALVDRLLREAEEELRRLLAIGATSERWSLLGGVAKRRLRLRRQSDARAVLGAMTDAYGAAHALAVRHRLDARAQCYALANQVAGEIALEWQRKGSSPRLGAHLAELARLACPDSDGAPPDFWTLVRAADVELMRRLAAQRLDVQAISAIQQAYGAATARAGSPRELDSVADQLRFFELLVAGPRRSARAARLATGLKSIRRALEARSR